MTLRLSPSYKTRGKSRNRLHNPILQIHLIQLHPSQPFGCSPWLRHDTHTYNDSQILTAISMYAIAPIFALTSQQLKHFSHM